MKKQKHNTKRVQKLLESLDWMFETNNFNREIVLKKEQPSEQPNLTAEVLPDLVYRDLIIYLYPRFWEISKDLQRKALLHELVHVILQDTKIIAVNLLCGQLRTEKDIKDANEKATSKITNFIDRLFRNRLDYAKKAYKNYLLK